MISSVSISPLPRSPDRRMAATAQAPNDSGLPPLARVDCVAYISGPRSGDCCFPIEQTLLRDRFEQVARRHKA